MNIIEFLEARIAEDEAVTEWQATGYHESHASDSYGTYSDQCPDCTGMPGRRSRLLAECEAKRAIVAEHGSQEVASLDRATWGQTFLVCRVCAVGERQVVAPCPTLRVCAAIYKDHPDYREEWAA